MACFLAVVAAGMDGSESDEWDTGTPSVHAGVVGQKCAFLFSLYINGARLLLA